MSDRVSLSITDGVADVRLDRPEKLNALDSAMFNALIDAADQLASDPTVRAVVLSGEGRGFCAGLDMTMFTSTAGGRNEDAAPPADDAAGGAMRSFMDRIPGHITNIPQQAAYAWTALPMPVIAALHGPVLGGGIQIALGADIRLVAPDAKLSVLEIRWGILPDMTGLQMLPRLVGLDVAKELTFTGRMVSGTEAVALGLATRLSDNPREDALELACEIAAKNPAAIRGAKSLLNAAGTRPLAESFLEETRSMAALLGSPNQLEAVMAYVEQRPAVFRDTD